MSDNKAAPRFYQSPVDYEAWRKGYMPPSEHILIHELTTGEARVLFRTSMTGNRAVAIVSINGSFWEDGPDVLEWMEFIVGHERKRRARKQTEATDAPRSGTETESGAPKVDTNIPAGARPGAGDIPEAPPR